MEGIDWHWGPTLLRALAELRRRKPDVVVFQRWTGSVLHTYLVLALAARALGASVIVEFHEVQDTGEARIPLARAWVRLLGRPFFRSISAFVVHSESDRQPVRARYRLGDRPRRVIAHGPNDHHAARALPAGDTVAVLRDAPPDVLNLLCFGIIRPYKGLEDLVRSFELLDDDEVERYWVTTVGETWEGWNLPLDPVRRSRYRDRMTVVNRFVDDDEVVAYFAGADAVVLPYHRSSASPPASVAMSNGLPLVMTAVGGLPTAVEGYQGAILVPLRDPVALSEAIRLLPNLCGRRYEAPHSWEQTAADYAELIRRVRPCYAAATANTVLLDERCRTRAEAELATEPASAAPEAASS